MCGASQAARSWLSVLAAALRGHFPPQSCDFELVGSIVASLPGANGKVVLPSGCLHPWLRVTTPGGGGLAAMSMWLDLASGALVVGPGDPAAASPLGSPVSLFSPLCCAPNPTLVFASLTGDGPAGERQPPPASSTRGESLWLRALHAVRYHLLCVACSGGGLLASFSFEFCLLPLAASSLSEGHGFHGQGAVSPPVCLSICGGPANSPLRLSRFGIPAITSIGSRPP